jgi:hypothetical protein
MLDVDKKEFSEIVQATLGLYRSEANTSVLKLWWAVLSRYEINQVRQGFERFVSSKDSKFAPVPANIIDAIEANCPDGRPGADEAWAMIPMDEYASAVMTQEMAEALHIAQPLLDAGDKIAARMSFREAYNRIVDANKRNGVKPSWFPSLGQDKEGRDIVLADAVRLGRIGAEHAIGLVAPEKIAPMLQSAGEVRMALEHKMPTSEAALANIARIKSMLAGSKLSEVPA